MCKNRHLLGQVPGGGEVVAEEGVVVVACEDGRVGVQEEGGDIYIVAFGRMMLSPFLMNIDFTLGVVLCLCGVGKRNRSSHQYCRRFAATNNLSQQSYTCVKHSN